MLRRSSSPVLFQRSPKARNCGEKKSIGCYAFSYGFFFAAQIWFENFFVVEIDLRILRLAFLRYCVQINSASRLSAEPCCRYCIATLPVSDARVELSHHRKENISLRPQDKRNKVVRFLLVPLESSRRNEWIGGCACSV
jgi:hypothetical protein